jgi:hypothetical protein
MPPSACCALCGSEAEACKGAVNDARAPAVPRGEGSGEDGHAQERVRACVCWGAGANGVACACVYACEGTCMLAAGCVVLGMARLSWACPAGGFSTVAERAEREGSREQRGALCWRWLSCRRCAGQEGSQWPRSALGRRGLDSGRVCCTGGSLTAAGVPGRRGHDRRRECGAGGVSTWQRTGSPKR